MASVGARSRLLVSPDTATRLTAARDWLESHPRDAEVLVVAPTSDACDDLVRTVNFAAASLFGVTRLTLNRLAARLAGLLLAARRLAPATELSLAAVTARTIHLLGTDRAFSYFAPVASRPGFASAVARTLDELRMNKVPPGALHALPHGGPDLEALALRVDRELADAGLADRAVVFAAAIEAVEAATCPVCSPLLLLDLSVLRSQEAALVEVLAQHAPSVLATAPMGDTRTIANLEELLSCRATRLQSPTSSTSLAALKTHAFEESAPVPKPLDESVTLRSWPGEARECVEITRSIQAEAGRGVPFDHIAVFLRSTGEYRPHLEEAFRRAAIPAYFARGTTRRSGR